MNIGVVGTGYVGLVTGACLAQSGQQVTCFDINQQKIRMLRAAELPFFEPGLQALLEEGIERERLDFQPFLSTDTAVDRMDVIFLTIGTPSDPEGRANLASLMHCVEMLDRTLVHDVVIAVKSTVPVGTCEKIHTYLNRRRRSVRSRHCVVVSNPEFLAESRAVQDFQQPARIVIGSDEPSASERLRTLYAPFDRDGQRILSMSVRSAEFAKYACNAALATRVSMINELACIAGAVQADMTAVCRVMTSDPRIGPHYLKPGAGYGGSCLPKDLRALQALAHDHGEPAPLLHAVESVNALLVQRLCQAVETAAPTGPDPRPCVLCVALWGLAFKAGTDDLRESPGMILARRLVALGIRVQAFDPVAGPAARAVLTDARFQIFPDKESACQGADLLVVMTGHEEFRRPDWVALAHALSRSLVVDGRGLYDAAQLSSFGLRHLDVHQCPAPARAPQGVAARTP